MSQTERLGGRKKRAAVKRAAGRARFGAIAILGLATFVIWAAAIGSSSHAQLAPTATWPIFHHDLSHSGLSPYDTAKDLGRTKWSFTAQNHVESSPAIGSDGTIYFGSDDGNFYALDSFGNLKWKFPVQNAEIVRSSPAIGADGTIYFGSEGG